MNKVLNKKRYYVMLPFWIPQSNGFYSKEDITLIYHHLARHRKTGLIEPVIKRNHNSSFTNEWQLKFTESEIKAIDEGYLAFAIPVGLADELIEGRDFIYIDADEERRGGRPGFRNIGRPGFQSIDRPGFRNVGEITAIDFMKLKNEE
ncbi:MAG: DUF1642 domain-containing protein [Enterococcus aquimarinus]|uniref:DUF1642 domain-containing protein n=1 Tax=Enterococcus aquimarinus TaxID=328396 RepID=A0A9E3ZSQ5_9ENTE|nr:DUF1642 domain-containing protein [Enterococcus aquimarinus]